MEHFTTLKEIAAQLAVNVATLRRWLRRTAVVKPFQVSNNFQNVTTHGTYRVAVRTPVKKFFPGCDIDGFRRLTNISGQLLGFKGEWSPTSYSSQVVVGATVQSDMSWTFIDANSNSLFNAGEQDMSGKTIKSFGDVTRQEYDISDINSGLYIVTVWGKDEKVYTRKLSVLK